MLSMQNITGFGEETKYYAEIAGLTLDIMTSVPEVLRYLGRSPVKNYVLCLSEMSDVVLETEGLVADFVDIVNNGKVQNPLKKDEKNKGDGYNFLNRYERLTLANRIYSRLLEIKYKMDAMCMMCEFCNGINDVLIYMGVTRQAQSLYKAFVWNPVTRQFYEVEEFLMIEEPTFDANSKTITSYARDGATMYIDTYQWKNGKLKKIASEKDEMN